MNEQIDALLLKHSTTGNKQVWFTRGEVVNIASEAIAGRTLARMVWDWLQTFKPARGDLKDAAK